jgi:7,8-dihydropterin-6-yl-methyl-4-(beta-D-ribofuranosyl)aminobenzene 5'-phosphate synthase
MGNDQHIRLREAERVEIISLVDNCVDFLSTPPREEVKTFREWVKGVSRHPIAEHGFSMLIRVFDCDERHSILFDTGCSPRGAIMNAKRMRINLTEVECILISHGHYDHFIGLPAAAKLINKVEMPILVHRDMFRKRGSVDLCGALRRYPSFPPEDRVKPAKYIEVKEPHLIANGLALVTGEIPRKTFFEKGYPQHRVFVNGRWEPDPWIWDERALVINVKRKGLVILSGCSHAGIINTINHARHLTGIESVHAVLGGFHLAGREFEGRVSQTVEELKRIEPRIVVPSHCTGWRALLSIYEAMSNSLVPGGVGSLYIL